MKKNRTYIFLLLLIFMTGCASEGLRDGVSENMVNDRNNVSENPMGNLPENLQGEQTEDMQSAQINELFNVMTEEIVCENPYFFPKNISFITAEMTYYYIGERGTTVELELHWLRQYDKGCLAKLSIVPFDEMPDYVDESRLNTYFYVTDSEIYLIPSSIVQGDEIITFYNDDTAVVSILDTDEKLMENGELVCSTGDVEDQLIEGEVGTHISIEHQGNQIIYNRKDVSQLGDLDYYESFVWEEGVGLVDFQRGYNTEERMQEEIIYLENIIYGTTDQEENREIVCENPYFFSQNVSTLTTELTYGDPLFETSGELELYWLKQYDNGCLVRLSVVPFDIEDTMINMVNYLDMTYLNLYFYVTPDEIYRIHFYAASEYFNYYHIFYDDYDKTYFYAFSDGSSGGSFENMDVYINHNDDLIMAVLNTDERLIKYGELVCSTEEILNEVKEGEGGIYRSLKQEGEQVLYCRAYSTPYNLNDWENFCWENGQGLVEYRRGFRAERDPLYLKNIVVAQ